MIFKLLLSLVLKSTTELSLGIEIWKWFYPEPLSENDIFPALATCHFLLLSCLFALILPYLHLFYPFTPHFLLFFPPFFLFLSLFFFFSLTFSAFFWPILTFFPSNDIGWYQPPPRGRIFFRICRPPCPLSYLDGFTISSGHPGRVVFQSQAGF